MVARRHGDRVRIQRGGIVQGLEISAQGGRPYPFSSTELSETQHVLWAPRSDILYHKIGNRNYQSLDPKTEKETPVIRNDSVGWIFLAEYSPDGKKFAAFWNRPPLTGLWIVSVDDGAERFTGVTGDAYPAGWSADGKWLYAHKDREYLKIDPGTLRTETLPAVPFMLEGEVRYMPIVEGLRIFVGRKTISDVWIIENFGRQVK